MNDDIEPDAEIPRTSAVQAIVGWVLILAAFSALVLWDAYTLYQGMNDGRFL